MAQLSPTSLAIVAAHWNKPPEQLTQDDVERFNAQFPGTLASVDNREADQSQLFDVPAGLRVVPNPGGGDCLFLALMQLLEPKQVSDRDLEATLDEFRRVTAEGLEPLMQDSGETWKVFKTLVNQNDQAIIRNIEDTVQKTFEPEELQHMSGEERDAIEKDWFKQAIREKNRIWGDNMYLLMFLRSPLNPYTQQTSLNILLIDRLAPALLLGARQPWSKPLCFGSAYMFPGQKCFWGILIRTRTDDGRGAMHYEAATLPEVGPTRTRFQRMYDTRTLVQALTDLDYLPYVLDGADNADIVRRCLVPFERRR